MAQSSGGGIIKWGLIALAGWWVYENYFSAPTAAAPALPAPSATPAATPPASSSAAAVGTLSTLFTKLQSAEKGAGVTAAGVGSDGSAVGPDGHNYYLALPEVGGPSPAPDPGSVFPGVDRSKPMPLVDYWAGMSAYLAAHNGMSGLRHFAGLARAYGRYGL